MGILQGLAGCDPFGALSAGEEALHAAEELRAARRELAVAHCKARLTQLLGEWDKVLASYSAMDLWIRSTCMHLGHDRDSVIGQFDLAGWSVRDQAQLETESNPKKRRNLQLQREVVTRLAGKMSLQQPWLGSLEWLDDAVRSWDFDRSGQKVEKEVVAEEVKKLFTEVVHAFYHKDGRFQVLGIEVIDCSQIMTVFMELRVHKSAFQPFLPGILDEALEENDGFHSRVAAGLRPAAAVAFRGQFLRCEHGLGSTSSRDLCALICSFLPSPKDAVQAVRDLAAGRRERAASMREAAKSILTGLEEDTP